MSENKVLKSGIWYTVSSIAIRAIGIITAPIYTSLLSTGDYGLANTFNSWIDIFNVITCLCVVYSIGRAKIDFEDRFDEYVSALQGLSSSFAFLVLIFVFIFRDFVSSFIRYEVPLVIVLFVYLTMSPSVEYMLQKCRYEYKYKENIAISVINCLATIAFSIALIFLFNDKRYFGKILGATLPMFLMGLFCYVNILKKGRVFYNKEYWIYALKFGLPMIPHAFAMQVLAQVDRVMIKDICGESDAGLYSFAYTIAVLLSVFTNAIGQAWLPWFNEQLNSGLKVRIREIQKKLVLLGIFLSLGLIMIAPEAVMLLSPNSPDYWVSKWVVPSVALGVLAQYFYTNYVNLELFHKKTPIIAVSSVLAALINYGLNALAIPRFGYIAAAYTTLLSYLFLMVFHFLATRFVIKEKVYADLYMFAAMGMAIALGLGLCMLYRDGTSFVILRYSTALAVLIVFAIIKRRDIMLLVDFIRKKYLHKE